jgi:hypothetical protein
MILQTLTKGRKVDLATITTAQADWLIEALEDRVAQLQSTEHQPEKAF